jgi:hypothetical protein
MSITVDDTFTCSECTLIEVDDFDLCLLGDFFSTSFDDLHFMWRAWNPISNRIKLPCHCCYLLKLQLLGIFWGSKETHVSLNSTDQYHKFLSKGSQCVRLFPLSSKDRLNETVISSSQRVSLALFYSFEESRTIFIPSRFSVASDLFCRFCTLRISFCQLQSKPVILLIRSKMFYSSTSIIP